MTDLVTAVDASIVQAFTETMCVLELSFSI